MKGRVSLGRGQLIHRSLTHRRARSFSALIALTVSAAVATALLTLYGSLDQKLHHEFRGFGANVVLTGALSPEAIAAARRAAGPDAAMAAFAYAVASTDRGTPVVIAGVDFPSVRRLDSWWQVSGWPSEPDQALVGVRAADFVGNAQQVSLSYAGRSETFAAAGQLRTGGDEDSRVYLPMSAFSAWIGTQPSVLEIQVPGSAAQVEAAIVRIRQALPELQVEPVRELVEGESRIVDRTHALMFAAVLLIALTVAVSVLATLSASVLERRRDFALMKALGSSEGQLMMLFLLETLLLAVFGLVLGWMIGSFAAWIISEVNFGTATLPRVSVVLPVLALNLAIAALAALIPVRSMRSIEPAALLKGE